MSELFRIVDARPIGTPAAGAGDAASSVLLALLSTLDPARLETALFAALLHGFRADRCALIGEERTTEFRDQIAKEAQTRGEALAVEGSCSALCAPLLSGALILERAPAFSRPEVALLASLAPQISLALRNARLFERSTADALTALPNRQRFVAELEQSFVSEGPLTLILADVDHFQDKNDVYGRTVGDRSLAELGDLLRHLPVQAVARSGDDEFALLLRVDAARARDFAEDFRKTAADRVFDEPHEGIHLTISAGVAERRPGEMPSGLFTRATEALAAAKRDGRNRVAVAR
ncbi:MAG TPA: sensor domain-containing diguanylate cyclase [Planctomycetota bacterium]|jgi:diguanylate cyclase (GGDEF)-like protein|nr:sensor domain-containing diguanylate cyclase [Planctomycetota bacterium]